jgi:UDP-galactopyranose mutase
MNKDYYPVVIIGAGPTGLSAAYHLREDALLLDKNDKIGGTCRSEERDGFIFDYAGHIIFTRDPYAQELTAHLMGDNYHAQPRQAWVYSQGTFTPYPFQANTYGLPIDVVKDCVLELIEAQREWPDGGRDAANFEEFIYRHWGAGIARHFMIPYNRKLWTVPLTTMTHDWMGGRVPMPSLEQVLDGALRQGSMDLGPNSRFFYPLHGGIQAFMNAFLPGIGDVRVNSRVTNIDVQRRSVTINGAHEVGYDRLITTMPLPELAKVVPAMPPAVREAIAGLVNVPIYCVNLGIDRPDVTNKHWIYYPEHEFIMQRIFVQGNASPYVCPPGTSSLTLEISHSPHKPVSRDGLIERGIQDTIKAGLITPQDKILVADVLELEYAYVVYTHDRPRQVAQALDWLRQHHIYSAGRFGAWEYLNSDGALLAGKAVAETVARPPQTLRHPVMVPAHPSRDDRDRRAPWNPEIVPMPPTPTLPSSAQN